MCWWIFVGCCAVFCYDLQGKYLDSKLDGLLNGHTFHPFFGTRFCSFFPMNARSESQGTVFLSRHVSLKAEKSYEIIPGAALLTSSMSCRIFFPLSPWTTKISPILSDRWFGTRVHLREMCAFDRGKNRVTPPQTQNTRSNVNPGSVNPGWFIVVVPQNRSNSDKWLLKWHPQFNSLRVSWSEIDINDVYPTWGQTSRSQQFQLLAPLPSTAAELTLRSRLQEAGGNQCPGSQRAGCGSSGWTMGLP